MTNALIYLTLAALSPAEDAKAQAVATSYLQSLATADAAGKAQLLGGATYDAKQAIAYNPKIVKKGEVRSEDGSLAELATYMKDLDQAGFKFLGQETEESKGAAPAAVDLPQALKLVEQTRAARQALMKKFPVLSDMIRVDRPLYWHPKNPARAVIKQSAKKGNYHVDYVSFTVQSQDDAKGAARTWPLRIVRFKSDAVDTGWKVLPASEWDPE